MATTVDPETQILDYLKTVTSLLTAKEIATALYGAAGTPKMVNPALYRMKHQRKVFIVPGMGNGVHWKISGDPGRFAPETGEYFPQQVGRRSTGAAAGGQYDDAIVDYLRHVNIPSKASDIVMGIIGEGFYKKEINPALYRLEKEGIIVKTEQVKGPPLWSLAHSAPTVKPVINIVG